MGMLNGADRKAISIYFHLQRGKNTRGKEQVRLDDIMIMHTFWRIKRFKKTPVRVCGEDLCRDLTSRFRLLRGEITFTDTPIDLLALWDSTRWKKRVFLSAPLQKSFRWSGKDSHCHALYISRLRRWGHMMQRTWEQRIAHFVTLHMPCCREDFYVNSFSWKEKIFWTNWCKKTFQILKFKF